MDSPRRSSFQPAFNLLALAILLLRFPVVVEGGAVLRVKPKYGTPSAAFVRHDGLRRARSLAARPLDLPMGGSIAMRMWYTEIAIGTPPKRFQVHIDTGSDAAWVPCEGCVGCASSSRGVKMETYNPKLSKTARIVTADESFCEELSRGPVRKNTFNGFCENKVGYKGETVLSYYVTDLVSFGQVSSNPTIGLANLTFGCTIQKDGQTFREVAAGVEGLIGLSRTIQSIVFQMASSGRVRKEFAHCLGHDGGIFAIGHVVKPKLTTMTPLLREGGAAYMINVTAIEIGGHFHIPQYPTLIDTGAPRNVVPKAAYDYIMEKIFLKHPQLYRPGDRVDYFNFDGSVDAEFPTVSYQVNRSHGIKLYPHDYFIHEYENMYMNGFLGDDIELFIIGDVALQNKLFVYDLENKQIGWQDYNCSSSIELEDGDGVCNIGSHNITGHPN